LSGRRLKYASLARTSVKGISAKSDKPSRVKRQEAVGDVQLEHVQRHPEAKVASVIVMSPEHGGDIKFPPALSLSVILPSCKNSVSDTKPEPVLAMAMEQDGNVSVPHPSTSVSDLVALSENRWSSTTSASTLFVALEPSGDINIVPFASSVAGLKSSGNLPDALDVSNTCNTSINDTVVATDNECTVQNASSTVPTASSVICTVDDVEVLSDGVYGFVYIIDTSSRTFLSYNTILCLVDPVNRYGFAVVLQCNLENELLEGFKRLLNIMRIPPRIIFFNKSTSFVSKLSDERHDIRFVSRPHTDAMKAEQSLYKRQLRKWAEAYNNNWIFGAVIVQAVVNSLP